ncbi:MAG: hypothetical protein DHS20C18_04630 [Saprospiraceae bacterium]|nr:MAG: hypothetical protein DHS20C18_04630 [Saprospiraceae bacterium]
MFGIGWLLSGEQGGVQRIDGRVDYAKLRRPMEEMGFAFANYFHFWLGWEIVRIGKSGRLIAFSQ